MGYVAQKRHGICVQNFVRKTWRLLIKPKHIFKQGTILNHEEVG
jgi:hypothetical protein